VTNLVAALNDADVNVQLRHVPTETKWEDVVDHGYIAVYDAAGHMLVRRDGFQHNRKLRAGGAWDAKAVATVVTEVKDALNKEVDAAKLSSPSKAKVVSESLFAKAGSGAASA